MNWLRVHSSKLRRLRALAHLDTDVKMSGDGHFYLVLEESPKRPRNARIERAANFAAAYSVLLAHVHAPPGWPPQITIVLTPAEAALYGLE